MKKLSLILGILLVLTALLNGFGSVFAAEGQETCPDGGDWIKFDGLSGMVFEAGAPEGMLITEWCYKASTYVVYGEVLPPAQSVVITSTVGHELSHVSIRVIDLYYTPTNTPFSPPTSTPENTPTNTPSPTVGDAPTPSPSVPTTTVVPTLPPPPQNTPQVLPVTGGSGYGRSYMIFWLAIGLLGLGLIVKARNK